MNATIRIDGYDRVEQIAQGRHTIVFKAYDGAARRAVVFKVLLPHLVEDPRFLTRFKRSVQIATQIKHDNLVNVLLCGRADLSYFIAYEHYNGVTLEEILAKQPRIPFEIALQIVLKLAAGLEACHRKHLLHRDVRPGNVVLTRGGGVKLDNLALATDVSHDGRVAFTGHVTSTASYMSPEQTQGDGLSGQSDIFSLGVVAWELLCGERAFGRGSPAEVAERVRTKPLKRVSDLNPLLEPAFSDIVQRMVDKEPGRRYSGVSEAAADLRDAMRGAGCDPEAGIPLRFVEDPAGYTESHRQGLLNSLKEKVEASADASPAALMRCYEKLAYLEPANEVYRAQIERLRMAAQKSEAARTSPALSGQDPRMTYRIIIESIDSNRESKASFAVKLAEKLRVPLVAVQPFVGNLPAALPGAHMHRKAMYVAKILEELGAVTRVEACRPVFDRRKCPECGDESDAKAEYCKSCGHRFVAVVELRPGLNEPDSEGVPGRHAGNGRTDFVRRITGLFAKNRK